MSKFEFKPFIVTKEQDGKIILTEEKLEEMLKQAYDYGYALGSSKMLVPSPLTVPLNNVGTPVVEPYKITCSNVSGVQNGQST